MNYVEVEIANLDFFLKGEYIKTIFDLKAKFLNIFKRTG